MAYVLDDGIAGRARIGLAALAGNQTTEHEFRRILTMQGVAFYTSRLMDSVTITPETLRQTEERLAEAAALILPGLALDVIAFTCTSAAIVNGEDRIFARIHERRPGVPCTTPITAGLAAMRALDLERIALLTPYVQEINEMMRAYIERRGIAVPVLGSFNNSNDNEVARISPASIRDAVYELARPADVDGVFVSCGSLRVVDMVEEIEQAIGKPVTSSNHALAWHSLRITGYREPVPGFGRLFRT
jgi:maleate isomerase